MRDQHLFDEGELQDVLRQREAKMYQEIEGYERNYILNASVDDLCNYLEQKYRMEPINLLTDNIEADTGDAKVDVSQDSMRYIRDRNRPFYIEGTYVSFEIPFEGDPDLFKYVPTTRLLRYITARVYDQKVHFTFTRSDHNVEQVNRDFRSELDALQQQVSHANNDVNGFNSRLQSNARTKITNRRDKILKDQDMANALGFPLKRRDDAPKTYSVPVVRKETSIQRPAASTTPFKPEPILEMAQYENILDIISSMVQVIERSPGAFARMKEEDLRQHFLVQLNGQYRGQATGETFNATGKTDILIRAEDRNIFIAECKFWKGEKHFIPTIDQLLGYTSWRDTKTAIILFNRQKNLSDILSQIPGIVATHPNFKKQLSYTHETGFRFLMHQPGDKNRELYLTVLVFDVPAK
jgi:hypothetical protein